MQYEQANQTLATPPFLPNPILDALQVLRPGY